MLISGAFLERAACPPITFYNLFTADVDERDAELMSRGEKKKNKGEREREKKKASGKWPKVLLFIFLKR